MAVAEPLAAAAFKRRVRELCGPGLFSKSALNIRDGAGVLEQVLGSGRYRTVLEIGTYRGTTAAFMAQFCERVITIDLRHGALEQRHGAFDRQAFWRALGVRNIELILVDSNAEKAAAIAPLEFDLAFIDGDHVAPAPAHDFALVRRCGAVLLHDYEGSNGVTALVDSLPAGQVDVMDVFAFWRAA